MHPALATASACKLLFVALLLGGTGCDSERCSVVESLPNNEDVLVIGDSILAYNASTCENVGDFVATERGAQVRSEAQSGARVAGGNDVTAIPEQLVDGDWQVVVVNGGINDLKRLCDCGECEAILDGLMNADSSAGKMFELVSSLTERGQRVLLVGYYRVATGDALGYDVCNALSDRLRERYQAFAARDDDVTFVDLRDVIDPDTTPNLYDEDGLHPNPDGSRAIAQLVSTYL